MNHIGLFFGSFNPIHIGHLIVANSMLQLSDMDEVWFVVSPHNPHKDCHSLLPEQHRLQMVRLAIADNDRFRASDVEFHLPKPSFTAVTLAQLTRSYPDKRFSLIMGGDNLANFTRWRNYQQIIANHHIYVYPRPDCQPNELLHSPQVHIIDVPMMDISSTYIRQLIAQGHSPKYLLPDPVQQYLTQLPLPK